MKIKKGWLLTVLFSLLIMTAVACGKREESEELSTYKVYYVNRDETAVLSYDYQTASKDRDVVLEELLAQLKTVPEKLEYNPPLAGAFSLHSYNIAGGQLLLDFDEAYKNQGIIKEILVRAAIVRTLMQVETIQQVSFSVKGEPLTDASGTVVGMMNQDTFIDNAGNEINTYEKVKLRLYFANADGNGLTVVNRSVVYNSNFPVERQVVEEIIAGPQENDADFGNAYPVVNPDTKIVSVNIRDGICYVNLSEEFMNQLYNVTPEATIYALTNSLVELGTVNKVQISVNGETNLNYRESISLSTVFERNLDLIE